MSTPDPAWQYPTMNFDSRREQRVRLPQAGCTGRICVLVLVRQRAREDPHSGGKLRLARAQPVA